MSVWHGDLFRALIEWSREHSAEFTISEAAAAVGASYPVAKVYVRRGVKRGWFAYPRRGVYQFSGKPGDATYEGWKS